jgi:SAM-dependent methyltransferase
MSAHPAWDESYRHEPPPWDVGRPQAPLAELEYAGRVLDVGCGTGEHALLAAARGAEAVGVDVAATAIELARAKAAERGLAARFEVFDALRLPELGEQFDVVVDSGLYHVFRDVGERRAYASGLLSVAAPGGMLYLMCFSELTPGDWGPQRIREDELRATFAAGWAIESLARSRFEINPGLTDEPPHAWRLVARRR